MRPGEQFVVNGAVVEVGGPRRAILLIQNKASVLLGRDIMQPEDAKTPARRIYFPIMLMYLNESGRETAYAEFEKRLREFMSAACDPPVLAECAEMLNDVTAGEYYRALVRCRRLMTYERERLLGAIA